MADTLPPNQTEQPEATEKPFDPGEFVVAVAAEDMVEAQLLLSACDEADIPAILQSPRSGLVGTIASPVEGFNILVPRKDLDRALALLAARKEALESDPEGAARAAEKEEADTER